MKELLNRPAYFIPFAILWIGLVIFTFSFPKAESFLLLQIPHSNALNFIMQRCSDLADGIFIISLFLFLFVFIKIRYALILLTGFAFSGLLSQTLKKTIFKDEARPVKWYEQQHIELRVPEGLKPHSWNSFPSGHSATAGFIFTFLAFRTRSTWKLIGCVLLAFLAGYSRIYLYHHFPVDVIAGLTIGITTQIVVEKASLSWFNHPKLEKSIFRR
jgi:membrane-associated phospholipid phosphatase